MSKTTQTRNRESVATRKLKALRDDAQQHIANIDRELAEVNQRAAQLQTARVEMLGRLRLACEQLGEVEPLPLAVTPEEDNPPT